MGGATAHVARVLTGCGYKFATSTLPGQSTYEHMPTENSDRRDSLDKPSLSESFCSFFFAIAIVLFE